jgi:hypothetical protein
LNESVKRHIVSENGRRKDYLATLCHQKFGMATASVRMMQTVAAALNISTNGKRDLFFKCGHCGIPLVVDCAAAGMTLKCQRCGQPTTVPPKSAAEVATPVPAASGERLAELQRHLKENESQRTEINGYINQLGIQLHRWQLRLQTLNERNKELSGDIAGGIVAGNSQSPG